MRIQCCRFIWVKGLEKVGFAQKRAFFYVRENSLLLILVLVKPKTIQTNCVKNCTKEYGLLVKQITFGNITLGKDRKYYKGRLPKTGVFRIKNSLFTHVMPDINGATKPNNTLHESNKHHFEKGRRYSMRDTLFKNSVLSG